MPPEVVHASAHTLAADMWSLGILLYEISHGRAPFTADSLDEIKDKIQNQQIQIDANLKTVTKELLKLLLKKNSSDRLTAKQIKEYMEDKLDTKQYSEIISKDARFQMYKTYYLNKYRITDDPYVRKKMIEDSFGNHEKEENRKMPLKYFRLYQLNDDLVNEISSIGIELLCILNKIYNYGII